MKPNMTLEFAHTLRIMVLLDNEIDELYANNIPDMVKIIKPTYDSVKRHLISLIPRDDEEPSGYDETKREIESAFNK